ncbi:MAG: DUF4149 domain-containing protein [Candidatus Omnitrophica bacterium]|nr:DUF4149 domain-containing protein [Candidatus Omnitrophota bacterium]
MDLAYQAVSFCYHLSLIVWLGGIITIGFIAAPAIFQTIPSRVLAGQVATRIHRTFRPIELVCMVTLLISSAVILRTWENLDTFVVIRYLFIFVMTILAVYHGSIVMRQLRALREGVPGFDELPDADPRRLVFKKWHKISVFVNITILLAGLGALFLS